MQRCWQARRLKRKVAMQIELQRQAQEVVFEVAADLFDQAQGLAVAAEQQMLAVVQLGVLVNHPARAPAELSGALEYGDGNAAFGQRDRCGHAGVATANYSDIQFFSQVLNANQSL